MRIDVSEITYDPDFNCRGYISVDSCQGLAQSIVSEGLINPITVNKDGNRYKVVAGHRRFIAVRDVLGYEAIECEVKEYDDRQAILVNLKENLMRRDLTPSQELATILKLFGNKPNLAEVAEALGRGKKWVSMRLAIQKLNPYVRQKVDENLFSAFDIGMLITCPLGEQSDLANRITAAKLEGKSSASVAANIRARKTMRSKVITLKMLSVLEDEGLEPSAWQALSWVTGLISTDEFLENAGSRLTETDFDVIL